MVRQKKNEGLFAGIVSFLLWFGVCLPSAGKGQDMKVERLLQNLKTGQYSGETIDLNLEDVDLKTVVTQFGEFSGIPFELSPDIPTEPMRSWTYKCKGVPWDQVLALVIQEFNFEAVPKGDNVYLQAKQTAK